MDNLPAELRQRPESVAVTIVEGEERMLRLESKLGKQSLAAIEQAIVQEVLRLSDYNKTTAARYLGLTRPDLRWIGASKRSQKSHGRSRRIRRHEH
ncbi:MAG: hypothetical protein HOP00_01670 [Nitrospira sp.]|nr:hypothetical protein [Nitrospira sp.]